MNRADLFLKEIALDLELYRLKWIKYFKEKSYEWDEDILSDTILKCYETISRLGLKEGKKESFNYLFKSLMNNVRREYKYCRVRDRVEVEDINEVYETYLSNEKPADYKIVLDLWTDFKVDYILRTVELHWDKDTFYLFKCKWILLMSDEEILKATKNPNWKKDIRQITAWLKRTIKISDIEKDFNIKYPDVDLSILNE